MKALAIVLGAIAGCVVGWVAVAALVIAFGESFGLSNFEGQRDIMAAFAYGPVGGLIGLILGVAAVRRRYRA